MPRNSVLEDSMRAAEKGMQFKARKIRPHLAQEYRESEKTEDVESITFGLLPHARMCARGEVSPDYVFRNR